MLDEVLVRGKNAYYLSKITLNYKLMQIHVQKFRVLSY